ncbi:MAG: GNAT family N-acetyltransferase [Sphingomonadaceae bacterium]|nr:GNAT family N-acetyltransferase [Sphingomonadaceae bacterium]
MPQNAPPTLVTPRLTLRAHAVADFAESAAMWADEGVTRFIGGRPFTPEECWQRLLRYGGLWVLLGFGYWAVRETTTGRFVGEVGFGNFRRELDPPFGDIPEIGWALSPRAQGQGYAAEAVEAAVGWADAQRFDRTVCLISPDNRASIRVAERAGYLEYARTDFKGSPTLLFERRVG